MDKKRNNGSIIAENNDESEYESFIDDEPYTSIDFQKLLDFIQEFKFILSDEYKSLYLDYIIRMLSNKHYFFKMLVEKMTTDFDSLDHKCEHFFLNSLIYVKITLMAKMIHLSITSIGMIRKIYCLII